MIYLQHRMLLKVVLTLTLGLVTGLAQAEAFKEAPPPPQYGPMIDNGNKADEPQVTIVERNGATFEETRYHGRLYKIKVTPKIGKPYYLIDEEGKGVWHRYDGPVDNTKVPQWVILEF